MFGDAIILDQAWALQAVYAVFDRNSKAFKNIERYRGRFRRSDPAQWVWQEHGEEEQKLFLSYLRFGRRFEPDESTNREFGPSGG